SDVSVTLSVTPTATELARLLEPRAPRLDLRLAAMQRLAEAGVATRLFMMPVLPYLTDGEASIGALLRAARAAGAREAECNVLFLREGVREFFFRFLGERFPALVARYRALYASSAYVPPAFARTVAARFARLAGATRLRGR